VRLQVVRRIPQQRRVIFEMAQAAVTRFTQKTTYLSGVMIMIDMRSGNEPFAAYHTGARLA